MLVLQNIISNLGDVYTNETLDEALLKEMLYARVVLPVELFEEDAIVKTPNQPSGEEQPDYLPKEMLKAKEVQDAKTRLQNAEQLLTELAQIEAAHIEANQVTYDAALKAHQEEVKPAIDTWKAAYKRAIADGTVQRPTEYSDDEYALPENLQLNLPEFSIDLPKEPSWDNLREKLSADRYATLSDMVDEKSQGTFSKVVKALQDISKAASQSIVSNSDQGTPVVVLGGSVVIGSSSTSPANDFSYTVCTGRVLGVPSPHMIIQLPNAGYHVQDFVYTLHFNDDSVKTDAVFTPTWNGNVLTLANMFNNTLTAGDIPNAKTLSGTITFTNGQKYTFTVDSFSLIGCSVRKQLSVFALPDDGSGSGDAGSGGPKTDGSTPDDVFIPNSFGYRQLGIADYKKVVSNVCCYETGEVAHIENVMARELREKLTKSFHQTQVVETDTTEIETEKLSDTTTTERFEMQTEVSKVLDEQQQAAAHVNVSAHWGWGSMDAGASYASNTSKQESNRQAVTQAKDVTERAMERIVSKVKKERTVKTTDEFTEENNHRFDNTNGSEHVSGVYRFINAIYKNQVYNYGKRLMYEFMIPQPSKLHRLGMLVSKSNANTTLIDKPVDPRVAYPDFRSINENNYQLLAAQYGTQVDVCPPFNLNLSKSFLKEDWTNDGRFYKSADFNINLPDNYAVDLVTGYLYVREGKDSATWGNMNGNVYIGSKKINIPSQTHELPINVSGFDSDIEKELKLSISTWDIAAYNFNLVIKCKLSEKAKEEWQKKTFEAIVAAYNEQLRIYNDKLSQVKAESSQILDSNPLFYRQIEQDVLRRNCISYLLDNLHANSTKQFGLEMYNDGATFTNYKVKQDRDMDNYGSFVKFMEQAFEWSLMSYSFYPYYWANKGEWNDLYQFESDDAVFRSFMQSGMARVVVTIKPGFEDAIMHYLATGQIWNGGQVPVIGNPLYLSIVDELKEQEYEVTDTWTTVLPTHLIALQKSGVAVDATGLPCSADCGDVLTNDLKNNTAALGNSTTADLTQKIETLEDHMVSNVEVAGGYLKLTTADNPEQVVAQISIQTLKDALA